MSLSECALSSPLIFPSEQLAHSLKSGQCSVDGAVYGGRKKNRESAEAFAH